MRKRNFKLLCIAFIVIFSTLACGLFGSKQAASVESETGSEPAEESFAESPEQLPAAETTSGSESETTTIGGLTPGWHIYSNANYVNGLALHENTLWAATLGGVVAWDLSTNQTTKYTTLDGMGYLGAYDVTVCSIPKLRIVVATEKGLNFFDPAAGVWDTNQITPEEGNVGSSTIAKIYCDQAHNRLLIGYGGLGIYDYSNGNWQQFTESDGLAWNSVYALDVVGDDIWVGGYKGVSVVSTQGIQVFNSDNGLPDQDIKSIVVGDDGVVWLGTSGGLVRYQNGSWSLFNRDNVSNFPPYSITGLDIAPDGTLWMATVLGEIRQFDPASQTCLQSFTSENQARVTDLLVDSSGNVYYATYNGGIQGLTGGEWQPLFIEDDQLASNFVEDFAQDQDGNLWIGTDRGAHRLDANQADKLWELFQAGEGGPPASWFQGIFPAPQGGLWNAHDSQRASFFDGSAWQPYASDQGINGSVNAIAASDGGTVWFGTSEGLIIMEGGSTKTLTDADGLPSKTVRALLLDGDTLWVGTTDGLARLVGGNLEIVLGPDAPGLPDDNIGVIAKHSDGSLLLGTSEGLARYDGSQATTILEPEPLRTMFFGMTTQTVSDIAIDSSGTIWATTYVGLYYGDGQTWQRISTVDGLPTNNLNTVHIDQLGTVWVGGGYTDGGGGIARYVPGGELTSAAPEPAPDIQVTQAPEAPTAPKVTAGVDGVIYDEITGMPMLPDAEDIYAEKDNVLNYWTPSFFETARDFYLRELPKAGWLLDLNENGKCRDNDRCMGWHGGYDDPETSTWFFIKGEHAYLTLNLIQEGVRVNVILAIDMEYK
ncbi:MAG: hypothetical protein JW908_14495 [Anaerolineales bacterium]|nr:hypothetical protein [Anaerolineales bacterium]